MISVIKEDENSIDIALDGDLTIYVADKFNQEISSYLNKYQCIDVDLSNVSELDTSCYQVLLRAKLLSNKNKKEFNIGSLSEKTQDVFELYNLNNVFNHTDSSTQ
ncbi:MAG: STAS domain-containing protein [Gammaproteobacteria bacterium]|nr:STAS domain-containing protein [Gammaproteobacteria bacterium]